MKRILFPNDDGGVSIIIPIESIEGSMKDIPSGKPYLIIDAADIPTDRSFRNAWTADFTNAEVKA